MNQLSIHSASSSWLKAKTGLDLSNIRDRMTGYLLLLLLFRAAFTLIIGTAQIITPFGYFWMGSALGFPFWMTVTYLIVFIVLFIKRQRIAWIMVTAEAIAQLFFCLETAYKLLTYRSDSLLLPSFRIPSSLYITVCLYIVFYIAFLNLCWINPVSRRMYVGPKMRRKVFLYSLFGVPALQILEYFFNYMQTHQI